MHDAQLPPFDKRLREIYERDYSYEAALSRLSMIVGDALGPTKDSVSS